MWREDAADVPTLTLAAPEPDADLLILVDEEDREIGHLGKGSCHQGGGVLHRAFSVLIFNDAGDLLLQQRAPGKRLWPLYWSNSCCSHPRRGETLEAAGKRRLYEELGVICPLRFLFKFQYRAQFDSTGAEYEICSVFIGRYTGDIRADRNEVLDWRWISSEALRAELAASGAERFTPWFRMEWALIERDHRGALGALEATTPP